MPLCCMLRVFMEAGYDLQVFMNDTVVMYAAGIHE